MRCARGHRRSPLSGGIGPWSGRSAIARQEGGGGPLPCPSRAGAGWRQAVARSRDGPGMGGRPSLIEQQGESVAACGFVPGGGADRKVRKGAGGAGHTAAGGQPCHRAGDRRGPGGDPSQLVRRSGDHDRRPRWVRWGFPRGRRGWSPCHRRAAPPHPFPAWGRAVAEAAPPSSIPSPQGGGEVRVGSFRLHFGRFPALPHWAWTVPRGPTGNDRAGCACPATKGEAGTGHPASCRRRRAGPCPARRGRGPGGVRRLPGHATALGWGDDRR